AGRARPGDSHAARDDRILDAAHVAALARRLPLPPADGVPGGAGLPAPVGAAARRARCVRAAGGGLLSGRLSGKRALVTGGASGIGAAIAERFRVEGADGVTGGVNGGDVMLDVRTSASGESALAEVVARLGGLDAVVCNAGRPVVGPVHELAEAEWDDGLATNLKGVYLTAKAAW